MIVPRIITIADLGLDDFQRCSAWRWRGTYDDRGNEILAPVQFDTKGHIPASAGEVWCLSTVQFSGGSTHAGCAMCRGDSNVGPLAWSVWNGSRFVPLMLPPAPVRVLEKLGPEKFSSAFDMNTAAVFPLKLKVLPKFVVLPEERMIYLTA